MFDNATHYMKNQYCILLHHRKVVSDSSLCVVFYVWHFCITLFALVYNRATFWLVSCLDGESQLGLGLPHIPLILFGVG
jgi:hypothetical protein